jgi:hypothetical protein
MTGISRMFDSINDNNSDVDSITFGNNKKGKVIDLGKIAISNDLSISNVLLVKASRPRELVSTIDDNALLP